MPVEQFVCSPIVLDSQVEDVINDGVTDLAPSQNAVADALALKQDQINNTTDVTVKSLKIMSSGSSWMGFQSPATSNNFFTLPDSYGSDGEFLKTDGAGNLVWGSPTVANGAIGDAQISSITTSKVTGLDGTLTSLTNSISPSKKLEVSGGVKVTGDLVATNCLGIDNVKSSLWTNTTTFATYQTLASKTLTLPYSTNLSISGHGHGIVGGTGTDSMDVTIFVNGAVLNEQGTTGYGWGTAFVHSIYWVPVIATDSVTLPAGTHTIDIRYRSRNGSTLVTFSGVKLMIEKHGCN